jgi:hypothetical protein
MYHVAGFAGGFWPTSVSHCATCLDSPQGLPKKIEFDLLLTNLALELGNALPGCSKLASRLGARPLHSRRDFWRSPRLSSERS